MENPTLQVQPPQGTTTVQQPMPQPQPPGPLESRGDWHDFVPRKRSLFSKSGKPGSGAKGIFKVSFVILGLIVAALLIGAAYIFITLPAWSPERIRVTNVTDRSATVSWVTDRPSKGVVVYSSENTFLPFISGILDIDRAFDDRDVSAAQLEAAGSIADSATEAGVSISQEQLSDIEITEMGKYYVHHVTIQNLEAGTMYYFRVGNGLLFSASTEEFADDGFTVVESGSTEASFTTFAELEEIPLPDPSYGSVAHASGPVSDGVVFMIPRPGGDILPLSAVLNETGNWYIDLSTARSVSGEPVVDFDEDLDTELLFVEAGEHGESGETTVPMDQDAPAPKINIGADITDNASTVAQEPSADEAGQVWSAGGPLPLGSGIPNPNVIPVIPNGSAAENVPVTQDRARGLVSPVSAQEETTGDDSEIGPVLPPQTEEYIVTDDYVLVPRKDGVYTIFIPSVGEAKDVLMLEGEEYTFFVDENENGVWDDDEEKIELGEYAIELVIDDRRKVHTLDVVSGFNYLSFDYLPNKVSSCEFLEEINIRSKNSITQIARFESGMYEVTSYRRDTQDPAGGYCFPVVPGRGYVVRAYGEDSLTYQGYRLTEAAGVALDAPGWHLIGVNGASKVYTASNMIDEISSIEGLTAVNITKWRVDATKFEGLQKEEDNQGYMQVYGFDFSIEAERGYFVKVSEGTGVWEPE